MGNSFGKGVFYSHWLIFVFYEDLSWLCVCFLGKHVLSYIEKNRVDLQNNDNSNMPASMPHHAQVFKQP